MKILKASLVGVLFFYAFFTSMVAYSNWDVLAILLFGTYAFVCGACFYLDVLDKTNTKKADKVAEKKEENRKNLIGQIG